MGPGNFRRCRERIPQGLQGLPGGAELWFPPRPACGFPGDGRSTDVQEEALAASPLLEDLRRRLTLAFQWAVQRATSRRAREAAAAAAAREEQSCTRVEATLARLRAELVRERAGRTAPRAPLPGPLLRLQSRWPRSPPEALRGQLRWKCNSKTTSWLELYWT
ncbi:alanine and arginine-rich domain-containing protein isoform X1 [Symphalangus syndactylus]|uniref:alanine and arginine-rich domain-containing protein isoform X1 n=1 Tax=Symphalangus syndactylus TaxID=9590 RepID=UPI003007BC3C